jgi:ferritin-like metal-binding protein YciE
MKFNTLRDLYLHELQDLHSSANQVVDALPAFVEVAVSEPLQAAFTKQLDEAQGRIARLRAIFKAGGDSREGEPCQGIHGLIVEAKSWMQENAESAVMDAGLIASAQRILHHEIVGYGCVRTYAKLLGEPDTTQHFLQESLDETEAADRRLTKIAETINVAAEK